MFFVLTFVGSFRFLLLSGRLRERGRDLIIPATGSSLDGKPLVYLATLDGGGRGRGGYSTLVAKPFSTARPENIRVSGTGYFKSSSHNSNWPFTLFVAQWKTLNSSTSQWSMTGKRDKRECNAHLAEFEVSRRELMRRHGVNSDKIHQMPRP